MIRNQNKQARGITPNFMREINERISRLKEISEANGVALPQSLINTAKELQENAVQRSMEYEYADCSYQNPYRHESHIGVPPPQDLVKSFKEKSYSLSSEISSNEDSLISDESLTGTNLKQKSKSLVKGVKEQLKQFKSSQNEYLKGNLRAETEAAAYQEELLHIKRNATEVLNETTKTKKDLKKMREQIENACEQIDGRNASLRPDYIELDMSSNKSRDLSSQLAEQIKDLQRDLDEMNRKIMSGEAEIQQKDRENTEINELLSKLKESFVDKEVTRVEDDGISISCKSCIIF